MSPLKLTLGVKTDPIEYRYSYPWLFRLLADEGIRHVQLGSFFEIYQLPDEFFVELRQQAAEQGIAISSLFTAHRELGGFFREEPGFERVARRNFERFIEIGGLIGAASVGSNPGALLRDRMEFKPAGVGCYLRHMRELMGFAKDKGVQWLTIEPMSCLAEPPTLPDEIRNMAEELIAYHRQRPDETAAIGYCTDIAHGYADAAGNVVWNNEQLLTATLPYLYEVHLKNTDAQFNSTFGFGAAERQRGIIDLAQIRELLHRNATTIPVQELICYLEIGGPKLGRDYTDFKLEAALRESLRFLKEAFGESDVDDSSTAKPLVGQPKPIAAHAPQSTKESLAASSNGRSKLSPGGVQISPSVMCADQLHLLDEVRRLEAAGVHMLHMDIMDGHFAPNLSMGLPQLEQLRAHTKLPFDAHLMVQNNDLFVDLLAKIGVEQIAVHVESSTHLDRTLALIRQHGIKAGAAINPHTPADALRYVIDRLDFVLVMTVNPGFAGQKLVPSAIRKIADVRRLLDELGSEIPIEVDGNVSFENVPAMVAAGADILVAGTSSLFHRGGSLTANVEKLNAAVAQGTLQRNNPQGSVPVNTSRPIAREAP